jgi:hypothetical protein
MKLYEITNAPASKKEVEKLFNLYLNEAKENKIIDDLEKIFLNEHPDFAGHTIHARPKAISKILKTRNERVYKNMVEFLYLFKNMKKPFEYNLLQSGQMRAHGIKHSSKADKEFSNSIKVDITGKSFGLLFHAGPKKLPSVELGENDIYLVAFGDHSELGT